MSAHIEKHRLICKTYIGYKRAGPLVAFVYGGPILTAER